MLGALALSATGWGLGFRALGSATGTIGGVSAAPIFMFAVVALVGGLLDARLLRAGHLEGGHRLARHLWRLGFAMWIATLSFFLGQAKVFPDVLRQNIGLRAIPVLLVAGVVAYWLARVLRRRRAALIHPSMGNS
jgi:hypothetical protein